MWKLDKDGTAYNADDPREIWTGGDVMFVRQEISIIRRDSFGHATIVARGFFSVDAAKKHLAQMVNELNAKEQELEEI